MTCSGREPCRSDRERDRDLPSSSSPPLTLVGGEASLAEKAGEGEREGERSNSTISMAKIEIFKTTARHVLGLHLFTKSDNSENEMEYIL